MRLKDFRVIIRSVKASFLFILLNVILNTMSINYIIPEYQVKTNCQEQTFLYIVVWNRLPHGKKSNSNIYRH